MSRIDEYPFPKRFVIMKIVLAFDSFKGSLSASAACDAAAQGLARFSPAPVIVKCPLSDGGEGFVEALARSAGGKIHTAEVTGPLFGKNQAEYALIDNGQTAVVESAQACGLGLIPRGQRSPLNTTSYGLGELLAAAASSSATRIVIGLGGSATNDGGMGMLTALGWQFLDANGNPLPPIGRSLASVESIVPGRHIDGVELVAACDVTNPLFGPHGAAHTFAPQKGATPGEVRELDEGLEHYAQVCAGLLGRDWSTYPGAGAAGGLGFALLAFLGARYESGGKLAVDLSGLRDHLRDADLCLTGEGMTDGQTAFGKLPAVVAACCAEANVPCIALSGALGQGWRTLYLHGFTAIFSIAQRPQRLSAALKQSAIALADTAEGIGRIVAIEKQRSRT